MQLSHTRPVAAAVFDEPNLVSSAGLVPVLALAESAGLRRLGDEHVGVPTDRGANAGLKVSSLVAGMVAGADSIDDMALLRHGGMGRVFDRAYAPSTLGSFLRSFAFGHVRQLDAVASRFLVGLGKQTPVVAGVGEFELVDIDDTIVEVHGYAKQGAGFGYSKVRGLNALIATITTQQATGCTAPVIVAQRLRKGSCGSPRGAARLVADALATVKRLRGGEPTSGATEPAGATETAGPVLLRADSAYYGHAVVAAALRAGAEVSVTIRLDKKVKAAIAAIGDDTAAWQTIEYTDAVYDEDTDTWISRAEVAETPFTAFGSKKKSARVPGRLVVRRIPDLNPKATTECDGQATLFDTWRFHAFFTTTDPEILDTVAADKTHRGHAIIEQVHADLKNSALAHLPSGKFCANAAWLVLACIAFNLSRAAATLTGPNLARATTATIRRKLITVPARIASSARRLTIHLPEHWPWETAWTDLFTRACRPPAATTT
jgi:Transposase DDE domain group 1